MNDLVAEWIDKAEGDYRTGLRESRIRAGANYDAVCFHCQQCAEKYLKAFLQARGETVPPIHHLVRLLEKCQVYEPAMDLIRRKLEMLNDYAVDIRYPGDRATRDESHEAVGAVRTVRAFMRTQLGLATRKRKKKTAGRNK